MTKIAINDRNLHEVKMRRREYAKGTISYFLYPELISITLTPIIDDEDV